MHEIRHLTYDGKLDFKTIMKYADEEYYNGCEYHNHLDSLRQINKNGVYNSYDDAREAIEKADDNWYDQIACKYYHYPNLVYSKKYLGIEERLKEWNKKLYTLQDTIHYKNVKASFISCPKCNSKINKEFIRSNFCPVCRNDMRPKTTLDTIKRYEEIILNLRIDLNNELRHLQEKQRKNAKIMWLVKIEYHV